MPVLTKKVEVYKCSVCEHEWQTKDGQRPLRCAKCKTPYWDKPKNGKS